MGDGERAYAASKGLPIRDADPVDARTGSVLLAFSDRTAIVGAGGGLVGVLADKAFLAEPIDRIVENYASQYRNWLLRN